MNSHIPRTRNFCRARQRGRSGSPTDHTCHPPTYLVVMARTPWSVGHDGVRRDRRPGARPAPGSNRQRGSLMAQGAALSPTPMRPDCYEYQGSWTLTIVEPPDPACPEGDPSLNRVATDADLSDCCERRKRIVLNKVFDAEPVRLVVTLAPPSAHTVTPSEAGEAPASWIALIERVIGDTAPTLRVSLLLVILLAGLITLIVVGFGLEGAPFVASAGAALKAQRWITERTRRR